MGNYSRMCLKEIRLREKEKRLESKIKSKPEYKKKVWEHFWERKANEVCWVIGIITIPFIFGFIGQLLFKIIPKETMSTYNFYYTITILWLLGLAFVLILLCFVGVIGAIIISNWEKAKKDALDELKEKKN